MAWFIIFSSVPWESSHSLYYGVQSQNEKVRTGSQKEIGHLRGAARPPLLEVSLVHLVHKVTAIPLYIIDLQVGATTFQSSARNHKWRWQSLSLQCWKSLDETPM